MNKAEAPEPDLLPFLLAPFKKRAGRRSYRFLAEMVIVRMVARIIFIIIKY